MLAKGRVRKNPLNRQPVYTPYTTLVSLCILSGERLMNRFYEVSV